MKKQTPDSNKKQSLAETVGDDAPPEAFPEGDVTWDECTSTNRGTDSGLLDTRDVTISRGSFWSAEAMSELTGAKGKPEQRYTLEKKVGSGGGGRVFLGQDTHLERTIAIKIQNQRAGRRDRKGRNASFLREASITARLDHPNIIPVYDLDITSEGYLFLAMKNIEGRSLGALVREAGESGTRPKAISRPDQVASIFLKVSEAIAYAHAKGTLHQDVKPDNIMIGDFGEVLLIDWGAATATGESGLRGTPVFMAPEQASEKPVDERADVYGLGGALFNVLTLRYPLWDESRDEFWAKKRIGMLDPVTHEERVGFSPRLMAIALKALAANPKDRYPTIAAMAEDLHCFMIGEPVSVVPESVAERCARFYRTHRTRCRAVAVSLMFLLLLSGLYLDNINRKTEALQQARNDQIAAELTAFRLKAERRDRWIPVASHDFRKGGPLDTRFSIGSQFDASKGAPFIKCRSLVGGIQWAEPLDSEPRLDLEFRCRGIPCIYIQVRNVKRTFGRSLYLDHFLSFAKGYDRYSDYGTLWSRDATPFLYGTRTNRLSFWRKGSTWFAELNGHRLMEVYDPYPNAQTEDVVFGITRQQPATDLQLESVQICKREPAVYVSVLELGQALQRAGDLAQARAWFQRQARLSPNPDVAREAAFLAASTDAGQGLETQLKELTTIAEDPTHPFGYHALHRQILLQRKKKSWEEVLGGLEVLLKAAPELRTFGSVWPALQTWVMSQPMPRRREILARVARLPINSLNLSGTEAEMLAFLKDSTISSLKVSGSSVTDLGPLAGLKLRYLGCRNTGVRDISPLAGMPLTELHITGTPVTDLTPLAGMHLEKFFAKSIKEGLDLSPLQNVRIGLAAFDGTPLRNLSGLAGTGAGFLRVSNCGLTNLDFLKDMHPYRVDARQNEISDIGGVAGLELIALNLPANRIVDLAPLRTCAFLDSLDLSQNPVTHISALAGLPLRSLNLSRTRIQDLSPLLRLRHLERLSLSGSGRTPEDGSVPLRDISALAGLKVKSLHLAGNRLASIAPLEACVIAEDLNLSGNPLVDIRPLKGQPLEQLDISRCPVKDFSVLKTLKNLKRLFVRGPGGETPVTGDGSRLDRADAFSGLTLARLNLAHNNIRDLTPFRSCTITDALDLSGNPVTDLSPLAGQPFRHLYLDSTRVSDPTPLLGLKNLLVVTLRKVDLDARAQEGLDALRKKGVVVHTE